MTDAELEKLACRYAILDIESQRLIAKGFMKMTDAEVAMIFELDAIHTEMLEAMPGLSLFQIMHHCGYKLVEQGYIKNEGSKRNDKGIPGKSKKRNGS